MLTHKSQRHLKAPLTDTYQMTHHYAELESDNWNYRLLFNGRVGSMKCLLELPTSFSVKVSPWIPQHSHGWLASSTLPPIPSLPRFFIPTLPNVLCSVTTVCDGVH
jgi:hypothetical protein